MCARDLGSRPFDESLRELSDLADACLRAALDCASAETGAEPPALLALGKLGGRELNFSSDVDVLVVSWDDLETEEAKKVCEQDRGGHADEGETSILLHLCPDLVHLDRAEVDYRSPPRAQIGYRPGAFDRATETGAFGDPTLATADKGRAILEVMEANWLLALDQFAAD